MTKKSDDSAIEQSILQIVKKENPENVEQLTKLVEERLSLKEEEALNRILRLIDQEKIKLKEPSKPITKSPIRYMLSNKSNWFWMTIILVIATMATVFIVPEDAYPIVYIRYILGSIFILWLPGYTLIKALFPKKEIDNIERTALSIGTSIALVPIVGLLLNYTPFGIRLAPITISLSALTITLAVIAIIRERKTTLE